MFVFKFKSAQVTKSSGTRESRLISLLVMFKFKRLPFELQVHDDIEIEIFKLMYRFSCV